MFRYLVKFGGSNKLISVESKADFEQKCRTIFGIKQGCTVSTEMFFEEFNDFAEISVKYDLPSTGKLRLTVQDEALCSGIDADDFIFVTESQSTSDTLTPSEAEAAADRPVLLRSAGGPQSGEGSRVPAASTEQNGQRADDKTSAVDGVSSHASTSDTLTPSEAEAAADRPVLLRSAGGPQSGEGSRVPAASTEQNGQRANEDKTSAQPTSKSLLQIDRLTRATREKLLSGQSLGRSDWTDITRAVFEECASKQDRYPSNYRPIAEDMVAAYPNLIQGLDQKKATDLLSLRLKHRFKNWRKRSNSPTVLEHRAVKKQKLMTLNMPGYQPDVKNSAIDDQRSINLMKAENTDEETVKDLMLSTFPVRRRDVMKGMSVSKLKKLYPRLFTVEQLWLEMARITGRDHIHEESTSSLKTWKEKILEHTGCQQGEEIENLLRVLETTEECGKNHPTFAKEDDTKVIRVEEEVVLRLPDSEESEDECLLLWECLFWIFNLKTPKSVSNLNWFLREKVFGDLKVDRAPLSTAKDAVNRMLSS